MASNTRYDLLFATWEGGGNVPPVVSAVRRLVAAGHRVRIMSDLASRADVVSAGGEFVAWRRAPNRPDRANRSDQLRVVFIFDVWHPDLSAVEREAVTALIESERSTGGL